MDTILKTLGILFLFATVLPLIRHDQWWIRIFDFPRMQIAAGGALVACALVIQWRPDNIGDITLTGALAAAAIYQGYKMFPFTPLARTQVAAAGEGNKDCCVTVLVSNVLVSNRDSSRLLALIREKDPDVVFTLETNDRWEQELRPLEADYPYTIKDLRDDTYGLALYSRFPLYDAEIRHIRDRHVPSVRSWLELPCGERIRLYGLHPAPPYPKYAEDTTDRDAELFLVGKEVRREGHPTIVMGDLNDVAWSYTTDLFQKTSGLLDPRVGRGAFNSFHVQIPIVRCPVDHIFVSKEFLLVNLARLPDIGSDHFPLLARLRFDPEASGVNDAPRANGDEQQEVDAKIAA